MRRTPSPPESRLRAGSAAPDPVRARDARLQAPGCGLAVQDSSFLPGPAGSTSRRPTRPTPSPLQVASSSSPELDFACRTPVAGSVPPSGSPSLPLHHVPAPLRRWLAANPQHPCFGYTLQPAGKTVCTPSIRSRCPIMARRIFSTRYHGNRSLLSCTERSSSPSRLLFCSLAADSRNPLRLSRLLPPQPRRCL